MESKTEQKHILVTGGSGYIGGHTLVVLLEAGFRVTVVDNLVNSHPKCIERVEQITGKRVTFHLVDLCDYNALDLVFSKSGKIDAVIHFAGLKAVGESVNIPIRYYENNLVGTLNLLKAMTKYNCFNILFSSSATVYGDSPSPIPETASLSSTNPYGRTKLFIEQILKDLAVSADGPKWKIVLLRYFNPVGAHSSGLIGEDPEGVPNNLMPFVAQVAVGRRPHLNVFGNDYPTPDGTGVRDYIHVMDLAEGHLAALQKALFGTAMTAKNSNCEAYNLGRGQGYSVFQMLNAMSEACGRKLAFQLAPRRVGDIAVCFADATKAKNELKWEAKRDLKSMVESLWKWQSMNPNGFKDAPAAKQ